MTHVIYTCWTGDNEMSANRVRCLKNLKIRSECDIILITKDNLNEYILKDAPLHPAYKYLSFTHRADYLRTYLMNFYGGGYSDIKETSGSWKNAFESFEKSDKWMCGYREGCEDHIAYPPVMKYYRELIGNGSYISKPHTPLTEEWYADMIALLDTKLEQLEKFPATSPQDCKERGGGYPIEWNEMLGRIFHRISYKYKEHLDCTLPILSFSNYR